MSSLESGNAQRRGDRETAMTLRESERAHVAAVEAAAYRANVREQHQNESNRLGVLQGEVATLRSQLGNPAPGVDLEFIQSKLTKAEAEVSLQEAVVNKFEKTVNLSEQVWTLADIAHHKFAVVDVELRAKQEKVLHGRERVSRHQRMVEQTRDKLTREANHEVVSKVLDTEYAENVDMQQKLAATIEGRQAALSRVKHAANSQRAVKAMFDAKREESIKKRAETILDLKRSIDRSASELRGKNERNAQKRAAREQREKKEFNKLLADGQNPYEVFRRRSLEAKARKDAAELEQKIEASKMETIKRTLKFDEYALKKEGEEAKARQCANDYRASQGRQLQEQQTSEYMRTTTRDQSEWIDPSGRAFRIEPSQYTDLKLHSFGLGTKPADSMVAKLKSKPRHRNVEANPMFVLYDDDSDPEDTDFPTTESNIGADGAPNRLSHTPVIPGKDVGGGAFNTVEAEQAPMLDISASDEQEEQGPNKFDPSLSVYEQKLLKAARKQQLENIVEDQIVLGRKFKGVAFLSSPAVVEFNDFDVGETYTSRVVLTNVSYTFNVFKLLALPKHVQNFIDVSYIKPGRMSAGTTCALTITFTPKRPTDLSFDISFLAQTGPFKVPVRCMQKRVVPSISAEVVDFGTVVHGENEVRTIRISNDGALDTEFNITPMDISSPETDSARTTEPEQNEDEDENDPVGKSLTLSHFSGKLPKHSFRIVTLTFAPATTSGVLSKRFRVEFAGLPSGALELEVKGQIVDTPIYVEQSVIDVCTCVPGKEYGVRVVFRNRGSVTLRVDLNNFVREAVSERYDRRSRRGSNQSSGSGYGNQDEWEARVRRASVDSSVSKTSSSSGNNNNNNVSRGDKDETIVAFFPSFGFVQGRDKDKKADGRFEVVAKFRPTDNFLRSCQAITWGNGKVYQFGLPVDAIVHQQTLPVTFTLVGKLTTGEIEFSTNKRIDLGNCIVSQAARVPLTLRNTSALPQKYGFTVAKAKSQLRVEPGDGFGVLLPFEERELSVVFSPNSATEFSFTLECHTIMGYSYSWLCVGRGTEPPLVFSNTVVQFGAAAPGNVFRQSLFVTNPAIKTGSGSTTLSAGVARKKGSGGVTNLNLVGRKKAALRRFEFLLPDRAESGVWVTPRVGAIAPGETLRLEVEYRAEVRKKKKSVDDFPAASGDEISETTVNTVNTDNEKNIDPANAPKSVVPTDSTDSAESTSSPEEPTKEQTTTLQIPDLSTKSESLSMTDEPWSEHAEWMLPCFVMQDDTSGAPKLADTNSSNNSNSSGSDNKATSRSEVMWLQVKTTTVDTQLWCDRTTVSFGEVTAGSCVIETIRLRNYGACDSELVSLGLNPIGPFSILNSLRTINGGGEHLVTLQLKFSPSWSKSFRETLVLQTDTGTAQILLEGKGVSPHFEVRGVTGHTLEMGDALHGQRTSKSFTVSNCSTFPLQVSAQPMGHVPTTRHGRVLFSVTPEDAMIQAGESREMLVEFEPDLPVAGSVEAYFVINTPNKDSTFAFRVQGYASPSQLFVRTASLPLPPEISDALAIQDGADSNDANEEGIVTLPPSHRAFTPLDSTYVPGIGPRLLRVPEEHVLEFRSDGETPVHRSFIVGCLAAVGDSRGNNGGSFKLNVADATKCGFVCSATEGPLKPDSSMPIDVTFTPDAESGAIAGEWTEAVVECVLKGGVVPEGEDDDTRIVHLLLRGRTEHR